MINDSKTVGDYKCVKLISIRSCFVVINDDTVVNNVIIFFHSFGLNFFRSGISQDSKQDIHTHCLRHAAFGTKRHQLAH